MRKKYKDKKLSNTKKKKTICSMKSEEFEKTEKIAKLARALYN